MSDGQADEPRVVRYAPPFGLSLLFQSLPKNGPRGRLEVTYAPRRGLSRFKYSGGSALGIPDQTLLLALLEVGQTRMNQHPEATVLSGETLAPVGQELWKRLNSGQGNDRATLFFQTSWSELSSRCGLTGGGSVLKTLRTQLMRLCETIVWEYEGESDTPVAQSFLVAWLKADERRLYLAVNFRLASALFGDRYSPVSMTERLALQSDVSRGSHAFLSTTIGPGKSLNIGVETLARRLWPKRSIETPASTLRRQNMDVRDALAEIGGLRAWTVSINSNDVARVLRAASDVRDMTKARPITSETSSEREHYPTPFASTGAGFGAVDVSGLFSTENS
jgi:Replication protein C (RepC)